MEEGKLKIADAAGTYLRAGIFDPERMISLLESKVAEALSEGYTGLRVSSEMSWALRKHPGSQHMVAFESELDAFLRSSPCVFLCQYDERRFGPILMLYTLANHPIVVVGGRIYENFYYMPPPDVLGKGGIPVATLHSWLGNLAIHKQETLAQSA
jgi:hypothetical protein